MVAISALTVGAFGLGVGIGFVWGELKSHRVTEYAERRKQIGNDDGKRKKQKKCFVTQLSHKCHHSVTFEVYNISITNADKARRQI